MSQQQHQQQQHQHPQQYPDRRRPQQLHDQPQRTVRTFSSSSSGSSNPTLFSDGSHLLRRSNNVAQNLSHLAATESNSPQFRNHSWTPVSGPYQTTRQEIRRHTTPSFLPVQSQSSLHLESIRRPAVRTAIDQTPGHHSGYNSTTRTNMQMRRLFFNAGSSIRVDRLSDQPVHPLDPSHHREPQDHTDSESEDDGEDIVMNEESREPATEQQYLSGISAGLHRVLSQDRVLRTGSSREYRQSQHQLPQHSSHDLPQHIHQPVLPRQRIWRQHPQEHPLPNRPQDSSPIMNYRRSTIQFGSSEQMFSSRDDLLNVPRHQSLDHQQRGPRSYEQQQPQQIQAPSSVNSSSTGNHVPVQRPAFLTQPVYQLACASCIRPLCLRAMKAVMLSDHSKELYSTDMPPSGLSLVNEDRQVRHCACRIRDSACLGCGQVAGYHVTQPCSSCLQDQNNGHFWMFYSSAVYHYKRNRINGSVGEAMIWANIPSINHDQSLALQLRVEVPILNVHTAVPRSGPRTESNGVNEGSGLSTDDRPLTACIEMDDWLNSPVVEVVCR